MVRRQHEARARSWLAAPAALFLGVGFLVPLGIVLVYSMGEPQPFGASPPVSFARVSLDNYRRAFDPTFLALLWRTVVIALVGTLGCLVLGFPVAYALATRARESRKLWWLALMVAPFWASFLLRTFAWRILLSANGPLSTALQALGWRETPLALLDTAAAVQIGVIYNYVPLMILPIFVALDRIDSRLRDASRDLGATAWQTFWHVTVPLARPGIASGCLLVFIPLAGEYVTPAILGGARGVMAGGIVASQFLEARDWALGAAQAAVLVSVVLLLAAVLPTTARRAPSPRRTPFRGRGAAA